MNDLTHTTVPSNTLQLNLWKQLFDIMVTERESLTNTNLLNTYVVNHRSAFKSEVAQFWRGCVVDSYQQISILHKGRRGVVLNILLNILFNIFSRKNLTRTMSFLPIDPLAEGVRRGIAVACIRPRRLVEIGNGLIDDCLYLGTMKPNSELVM